MHGHSRLLFLNEGEEMAFAQLYSLALFVASTKSSSMYNMYSNMIMPDGKENYNVSNNYNESADTGVYGASKNHTLSWFRCC